MEHASPRFFVESLRHEAGSRVALPAEEAHHAVNVLRLASGAAVELFDGRGGCARARLCKAGRGEVLAEILQARRVDRIGPVVHVGFAVPKGKRLDWLLEKATELGAASLTPVVFRRSVAGGDELASGKRQRWLGHCVSAAKQCGLSFLPELAEPKAAAEFIQAHHGDLCLAGDPSPGAAPLAVILGRRNQGQAVTLLIGPEGGLTDEEQAAAETTGFLPARLGHTILRTETAVVALLAAVMGMCEKQAVG